MCVCVCMYVYICIYNMQSKTIIRLSGTLCMPDSQMVATSIYYRMLSIYSN